MSFRSCDLFAAVSLQNTKNGGKILKMVGNSQAVHRVTKTNKRQDCFDDGAPSTVLHDSAPSHTSVDGAPSSQTFKTKHSILTTTFKITVYGDPYLSVLHIE